MVKVKIVNCSSTFCFALINSKGVPNGSPCLDTLIQTRGMLRDLRKA